MLCTPAFAGLLDEIRENQKGTKTVAASFKQQKHTELLDRPIKSNGLFYFKSPVGVRWEYEDSITVIYDGTYLFLHYLELEEAERVEGVSGFVGPLMFDIESLLENFKVNAEKVTDGIRLNLEPTKQMPFKSMVMVFPDGSGFPRSVEVFEETGDRTEIHFYNVRTNVTVSDELLKFKPPPGVIVRERKLR
jgi:outer membrane lipoprotein-sorting protein